MVDFVPCDRQLQRAHYLIHPTAAAVLYVREPVQQEDMPFDNVTAAIQQQVSVNSV